MKNCGISVHICYVHLHYVAEAGSQYFYSNNSSLWKPLGLPCRLNLKRSVGLGELTSVCNKHWLKKQCCILPELLKRLEKYKFKCCCRQWTPLNRCLCSRKVGVKIGTVNSSSLCHVCCVYWTETTCTYNARERFMQRLIYCLQPIQKPLHCDSHHSGHVTLKQNCNGMLHSMNRCSVQNYQLYRMLKST